MKSNNFLNKLEQWRMLLLMAAVLGNMSLVASAQSSMTITASTPSADYTYSQTISADGFYLPASIDNQIGSGFSIDVTFSTVGLTPSAKHLVFGIGREGSSTHHHGINVFIKNGQIIVERRINTSNGIKTFVMPSWNTQMYNYGVSNVRMYFWITDHAMKFYLFEGTTDLTQNDPNRTCELQFYGMYSSELKNFLTNASANTDLSIITSRNSSAFSITNLVVSRLQAVSLVLR